MWHVTNVFPLSPPPTLVERHMATCVSAASFYDMNDRKDWVPLQSTAPPIPYSSSTTLRATLASPACRKGTQRRLSLGTFDSDHTFLCFASCRHHTSAVTHLRAADGCQLNFLMFRFFTSSTRSRTTQHAQSSSPATLRAVGLVHDGCTSKSAHHLGVMR
ncbi:hypothetical protein LX32DRAFT_42375 [Colletotrichum zoysiae]|uniref:Uncharacterized protein n=1 Tax=Colletotrichum zoysiae TaxID=1216348 RepID=A0AAD9M8M5_9PEZI|nr:hypothetical protein LX32DRAFT_42375 [Colletotrichum zoysiae]